MLIATETAVYSSNGSVWDDPCLQGTGIRRVAEGERHTIASLANGEIVVLTAEGARIVRTGITEGIESLLILGEKPLTTLIGTDEGHLYRLDADRTERVTSFDALECRKSWHTPWGGPAAVRSLAATQDGCVYADIHVGSIMRSPDGGGSWEPVTPELHEDVHQVAVSPVSNERVYANTARGVYISEDRGQSWAHRSEGMSARYGRAIAVHPTHPDCLLASVSGGPHGDNVRGRLYRSGDAGHTWTHVSEGFPASTAGNIDTFHVAFAKDGSAWAVVGKTLYAGREAGTRWSPFWEAPEAIRMIAAR